MKATGSSRTKKALSEAPPRTRPAEVRREELLRAAEKLFLRKGVAATSVDHIVADANVAKGTFYLYFNSKEQLLTALRERFISTYASALEAAIQSCPAQDFRGQMLAWVGAGVNGYLDRVALHDLVFYELPPTDPRQKHRNPVVDRLAELLRAGAESGGWSVDDPAFTANLLFHALHAAVDDVIARRATAEREPLVQALGAFFLRAVSPP